MAFDYREHMSPIERAAYDQGRSDAPDHYATLGLTYRLAFLYFNDSVRALGPNSEASPNLYCLYWSGVCDELRNLETVRDAQRNGNDWRLLANLAVVVADTLTESVTHDAQ